MDDEAFRFLLAEYAYAARFHLPTEGKLERNLKVAFATAQAENERLREALRAIQQINGDAATMLRIEQIIGAEWRRHGNGEFVFDEGR